MPTYVTGASRRVFPDGSYWFKVNDAYLETSSKGNPMIRLELIISGLDDEDPIEVRDYLVFSAEAAWKIDNFRLATGEQLKAGEEVNFEAENCFDRQGYCKLIVDEYQGRKNNKVADYIIDPDTIDPKIRAISGEPRDRLQKPTVPTSAHSIGLDDDLRMD
jgi:hypothetical protein